MLNNLKHLAIPAWIVLAAAFPVAALANVTGTQTMSGTGSTILSLDTGVTVTSGGDILWNGSSITPQGNATAYNIPGISGASTFNALNQATLSAFSILYSKNAINVGTLTAGDIFAVHTNGGNYAAVMVTAQSGTSITLQFVTFTSGSSTTGAPTITAVANNYSGVPPGFANSGIAQGAIFYITGTGLANPAAVAVLQNSVGANLPTTLNGASVKVTVGSTTVTPVFYYAISTALGMVLPSNTPLGTAQVTVTYNSVASSPYTVQIVATAPGILTVNQAGTGLGFSATGVGVPYTYTNPIPPGTTIVLVGSGLGADPKAPARDMTYVGVTSVAADSINAIAHFYVGGMDAGAPAYQGSFGFPGLNQINLTIPANAPTGCNVSVVGVTASGIPTNSFTLPIGAGSTCSDPTFGTVGSQLQSLSGQTNVKTGTVALFQLTAPATTGGGTTVSGFADASFQSYTGAAYGSSTGSVSLGGCIVNEYASSSGTTGTTTGLDAGTITVTGPSGTVTLMTNPYAVGSSYATLASGYIPTTGGTFTFKGSGGANVGAFTANVTFPNPLLTWTNQAAAATVTRSGGLLVTWTAGSSGTYVIIGGSSSSVATSAYGSFTCIAPLSAGQFTVPSYILALMPAGSGSVIVENSTNFQTFSASGLDSGIAFGYVATEVNSTYN